MKPFLGVANCARNTRRSVRAFSEADEGVSKFPVGVHGHMSGNVVEDVRFGQIVEPIAAPDRYGRREFAIAQAIKKHEARHVTADGAGAKPSERVQEAIDIFKPGDA